MNRLMSCLTILLGLLLVTDAAMAAKNIVNVYNWSGYIPDEVLAQFERETGIKINYSTYDSNETLYAKLKANPQAGYDVIVPSTYFVDRMRRQHMLQPIDKARLSNFHNLNSELLNKEFDPGNEYSIPYLYSVTAIALNTKYWPKGSVKSWSDLWQTKYYDKLLVLDDTREVFSMALISLGLHQDDTNPAHIQQAFEKLKKLMPNVKLFNNEAEKSIYIDEDVTIGMGWSGDIYLAQQENPAIEYIYPEEGFIIALDNMTIPVGAEHVDNAYRFINFILRADVAKYISMETGYATANTAAVKLMPKNIRDNATIYPAQTILARGHFQNDVGNASALYEKYFQRLKIGG
jgi:spermidine/putrescine transport system substrate-binding protein